MNAGVTAPSEFFSAGNVQRIRTGAASPVASALVRRQLGIDLNLEGAELAHVSFEGRLLYRNPFPGARFSDDELAVATVLRDTGRWARGEGPPPYPLAEGCQDHLIALAVEESAHTGATVGTQRERWAPASGNGR